MYSVEVLDYGLAIHGPRGVIVIEGEQAGEITSELEEAENVGEIQYILQQAVLCCV